MQFPFKTGVIAILLTATATTGAFAQSTPSTARPIPATDASLVPPDMTGAPTTRATPVQQAQGSSLVLQPARSKRVLVPRTGSGVPSGISGVTGLSNQSGGRSNGINDGADPSRGSNGAGGGIGGGSLGSRPLAPRDDTPQRRL